MRTLMEIAEGTQTDKGYVNHSYLDVYQKMFESAQFEKLTLMEIGVCHGDSQRMWLEFFPNAHIIGVDAYCFPDIPINNPRCTLIQCNQIDEIRLNQIFPPESLDIIIDDGSHMPEHQALTHHFLWPKLKRGGLYFVEDIQFSPGPAHSLHYWGSLPNTQIFELHKNGRYDDILVVRKKV